MGFQELLAEGTSGVITEEDRLMHTAKMVERAFGRPVADLGEVSMLSDGRAVLSFDYSGKKHTLGWVRQSSGAIFWYLDDSTRPLVLGQQERALARLHAELS